MNMNGIPQDTGWAWIVAFGVAINGFCAVGSTRVVGILYAELKDEFNASASLATFMFGIRMALMCITALSMSMLRSKFSYRCLGMAGGLFYAMAHFLLAVAPNMYYVVVIYGIFAGIGYQLFLICGTSILALYFTKWYSLVTGVMFGCGTLGLAVFPQIFKVIFDTYSLFGSLLVLGAIILHVVSGSALYRPADFYRSTTKKAKKGMMLTQQQEQHNQNPSVSSNVNDDNKEKNETTGLAMHISYISDDNHEEGEIKKIVTFAENKSRDDDIRDTNVPPSYILESLSPETNVSDNEAIRVGKRQQNMELILKAHASLNDSEKLNTKGNVSINDAEDVNMKAHASENKNEKFKCKETPSTFDAEKGNIKANATLDDKQGVNMKTNAYFSKGQPAILMPHFLDSVLKEGNKTPFTLKKFLCDVCIRVGFAQLSNPRLAIFFVAYVTCASATITMHNFAPAHLKNKGVPTNRINDLLTISGLLETVTRFSLGLLALKFKPAHIIAMCFTCTSLITIVCALFGGCVALVCIITLSATFGGAIFVLSPAVLKQMFPELDFMKTYALLETGSGLVNIAMPIIYGAIRDITGNYDIIMLCIGILFGIGSVGFITLSCLEKNKEDEASATILETRL